MGRILFFSALIFVLVSEEVSFSQLIFTNEFPVELMNKVYCGNASTTGKMFGGTTAFLDFPFKLTVSEVDGIFVEYNIGEQFGRNQWGTTQKIKKLTLWRKEPAYDQYGDIRGYTYRYKVYDDRVDSDYHKISGINVWSSPKNTSLNVIVSTGTYEPADISTGYTTTNICGTLLTYEESKKIENQKFQEELRLKKEKEQQDQQTSQKIEEYLNQKNVDKAAEMYATLNYSNNAIRTKIHTALNEKYVGLQVNNNDIEMSKNFTRLNVDALSSLQPGIYKVIISKKGEARIENENDLKLEFDDLYKLKSHNISGFEIATAVNVFDLNIKKTTQLVSTSYYCETNSHRVYKTSDNKFYYKVKHNSAEEVNIQLDTTVPKNEIKIVENYQTRILANDILIKESWAEESKIEPILKKD
jgi:hypothetical protein